MIKRSEKEIKDFISSIANSGYYRDFTIEVEEGGGYRVTVHQMYEYPLDLSTAVLQMCIFFETYNINEDHWNTPGCSSCDYGSRYEINFTIGPDGKSFDKEGAEKALAFFNSLPR